MPRILIVDDEQSMREWLRILFQRDGFEVLTADDGLTAKEIRELTRKWVARGGEISWAIEERHWKYRRDIYYWVIIEGIDELPRGLFG